MNKGTELQTLIDEMKAAAEKATPGEWHKGRQDPVTGIIKVYARTGSTKLNCIVKTDAHEVGFGISEREHKANAELIALANPANIRALITELEKAQRHAALTDAERQAYVGLCNDRDKRIAELEQQLIKPLPIGELLQRLENQTGQKWDYQLSVKLPAHKFLECVNGLLEEAIAYAGTQQLRERLSSRLANFVQADHPHTRCAGGTVEGSE